MTEQPSSGQTAEQRSAMGRLMRFCLTNKLVVLMLVVFIIFWGLIVAPFDWDLRWLIRRPVAVDAIPDIGENQQIVFTEWMGRSPQDVEDQITYPLTVSLLGVPGVKTIRSSSFFGFSSIYIIFKENIDFYWSRSRILEKLSSLPGGTLPANVRPALGPDATALGQIFWYTLEGRDEQGKPCGGWDLEELRTVQDWYVRYGLLNADGVSEVASVGGFVKEYQVDVDPDAMRAFGVTFADVYKAVKSSNVDVGAKTIELNRVEYFIRGIGFIKQASDIEDSVIKVVDNVGVRIKDVATVTHGPALRRGALDKEGAEAVGGVVVARYGDNPLAVIKNVKKKIEEISPGLATKVHFDFTGVSADQLRQFGSEHGFDAYKGSKINQDGWLNYLRSTPVEDRPRWAKISQVTIVPFYDRAELIYETLGTLYTALSEEILITIIVVILMVMHLRSSVLISGLLPLAVLMCFIGMKAFGVDANIVALSGIAIAIGTMVDMGIVICENILRHLDEADPEESRLEVIHRAASEVGGAILTAVSTTVISFLPVFTMIGAEGKLFKPLAFTKTFALIASVIVALTIIPPAAHILFCTKSHVSGRKIKIALHVLVALVGVIAGFLLSWWVGVGLVLFGTYYLASDYVPESIKRFGPWAANFSAVLFVGVLLSKHWEPVGPEKGFFRNFVFVAVLIASVLALFRSFQHFYPRILGWCLRHKLLFLSAPCLLLIFGVSIWLGPEAFFGPASKEGRIKEADFRVAEDFKKLLDAGLIVEQQEESEETGSSPQEPENEKTFYAWSTRGKDIRSFEKTLTEEDIKKKKSVKKLWLRTQSLEEMAGRKWKDPETPDYIAYENIGVKIRWHLARMWGGLGKEFMPPLDEGSFLFMPTTMVHASIGEAMDVLSKQDMAIRGIPEVDSVVGKIGRAETPLDPAPVSMVETVVNYKPEYITGKDGVRVKFRYGREKAGQFDHNELGMLIPDPKGRPFRQWRKHIKTADDIWKEILKATEIKGTTSAPKLQPIATRLVMLQTGMRAPMGVKVTGPSLEVIEKVGLEIERYLKEVDTVEAATVFADRIVGKPYLEIIPDRKALARYGVPMRAFQDVVEIAIGGKKVTTTVEGRERFPVRVRYQRELRDQIEMIERILVPASDGVQIPITEVAELSYVRGPQVIKSEDTFLVGYILFDMKSGNAEVDVVEQCKQYLQDKIDAGEFVIPVGVNYKFAGTYENQVRAQKTLAMVLPLALFIIFLILYFHFKSVLTTSLVFSGILVAWSGGFLMIWLYGQPWFLDFEVFGTNMQELMQIHPINLSVAVWVGFLALFGIASDDGVVMATYLEQSFRTHEHETVEQIREATILAGKRRVRACLMTTATTVLALLPVLTSTGRGSDVMVPMAIPSFGGMTIEVLTMLVVPVLYCGIQEMRLKARLRLHRAA